MKKLVAIVSLMVGVFFVFGAQVQAASLGKAIVAISVDDADRTLFDEVYPLSKEYGVTFTAYVPTGKVGDGEHVTWAELRKMNRSGCEVGNHTQDHKNLGGQLYAAILSQIKSAQEELIFHGFMRVSSFAFPFGVSSDEIVKALKEVGLTNGRGSFDRKDKYNFPATFKRFWIESVSYRTPMKHSDIKLIIDQAVVDKAGLSIVLHKVFPGAKGEYELDSYELEKTLAYLVDLRAQGKLQIKTVSQMAEELMYFNRLY